MYRGWVPTVLRDVPFSMIYWLNYETTKVLILNSQNKKSLDSLSTFLCGSLAGAIAAAITTPLDVVKTHRQIQLGDAEILNKRATYTINIIKEIYRTKGLGALFSG